MNVLGIIVAIIILGYAFKGYKDGLILTVCSFVTIFIAVAVTQIVTPQISAFVRSNESLVNSISNSVNGVIFSGEKEKEENDSEDEGVNEDYTKNDEALIDQLSVPKLMKEQLIKNNSQENYEELGVTTLQDYISLYIAYSIINCVTYVVVFLVIIALLKFIAHVLNVVSKLPVINTLNKLGGFAIGLAEGVVVTWIVFIVFVVIANTALGAAIYEQIEECTWLAYLYDNNLILRVFSSVMKGIF